ncbi:glycosyltransferase family 2 protein [Candidatus Neomarinimicrobiota bacterium]
MREPLITIVLPTYNRPGVLAVAIKSVLGQSIPDWKLLVIGDHCSDSTGETVNAFQDARVSYINLLVRFGEQSGPNSVGLALTTTPYVAFLNHDDILLPDHLEYGLGILEESGGDIFIGRSAFSYESVPEGDLRKPTVKRLNPLTRSPRHTYHRRFLFEPCSSWLIRTRTAHAIGPWRKCTELYRTPLQEWLLRGWMQNARFVFGRRITVWKIVTHYKYVDEQGCYHHRSLEHEYVDALMAGGNADSIRDYIRQNLVAKPVDTTGDAPRGSQAIRTVISLLTSGGRFRDRLKRTTDFLTQNSLAAMVYRYTRIDLYRAWCRLQGLEKGHLYRGLTRKRTGDDLPESPPISEVVEIVTAQHPV